ncbi:MFS transporter [Mesorhizobium sp.]|uniref:MFS transporter n=1 Tax=Mesorhizobium sp. TaxID=1871066 RepID=UPI0025BF5496|nr:MFS transporter [Mesorhizobium sp.]
MLGRLPKVDEAGQQVSVMGFMPKAWLLLAAVVVAAGFEQAVLALLPVYGTHYSIAEASMSALLSTMIAGNIAMQVPLGLLAERLTARLVRFLCVSLTVLGCVLLPLLIETPLIWPCVFIWGAVSYGIYTMSIIELGERFTGSALVAGNAAFSLMWGVGPATRARLAEIGVETIGQLARSHGGALKRLLGPAAGEKLAALAWNRDPRRLETHRRAHSAGAQSALGRKPAEARVFVPTLLHLADRVASRLRAKARPGRTVTVRVRFADMRAVTRSVTLEQPIQATAMLAEIAEELVRGVLAANRHEREISLLAISVSHLEESAELQLELPLGLADERLKPGSRKGLARFGADRAIDRIRQRFGKEAVGYGAAALEAARSVPDEFRELAEKEL